MPIYYDFLYLALALMAFVIALVAVPIAQKFGEKFGFMDAVNPAKIHDKPIVRCGGVGIVSAFMVTLFLCMSCLHFPEIRAKFPPEIRPYLENIPSILPKLAAIVGGGMMLFIVGLIDDKITMSAKVKLAFQLLATLPLLATGVYIKFFIPGDIAGMLLTVGWIVFITNAFNLLDNMNGLSSGVAIVCALNFYLVSRAGDAYFMMAMFALIIGSTLGFLRYNFPNARLFMGDSGSLFLGYMIGSLSVLVTYYKEGVPTALPVISPLVILGVPIFDTLSVMYIRWKNKKPFMVGDQNHFSHRLVALGFSRTQAVMFIWLVTLTVGLTAVNLQWLGFWAAILALIQVILFFLLIYLLEAVGRDKQIQKGE